ncbi:MAG: DUF4920 domain-containing protein [Pseudomarimonas sp.]
MTMLIRGLLIALFSSAAAEAFEGPLQPFGAAMPAGPALSVAEAIDGFAGDVAQPQKFNGRVARICRKKGCWMELEADGRSARVTMLDYGFFLPTDAHGPAEVFGTLSRVELDEKTAAHYAKDAGIDVADVPRSEYRIVAHSVLLVLTPNANSDR